jgi:hypothetical protein
MNPGAPYPREGRVRKGQRPRRRLVTVRLVQEGSFPAPDGYPPPRARIRSAEDVFTLMAPYVSRELAEAFWIEAGRLLDIPVYDHVIVGGGRHFSFAEAGLM